MTPKSARAAASPIMMTWESRSAIDRKVSVWKKEGREGRVGAVITQLPPQKLTGLDMVPEAVASKQQSYYCGFAMSISVLKFATDLKVQSRSAS